jgi:hypothetical protein
MRILNDYKNQPNACTSPTLNLTTNSFTAPSFLQPSEIPSPINITGPKEAVVIPPDDADASLVDLERRHKELLSIPPPSSAPQTVAKLKKELNTCRKKLNECIIKNWQSIHGRQITSTPAKPKPFRFNLTSINRTPVTRTRRAPKKYSP